MCECEDVRLCLLSLVVRGGRYSPVKRGGYEMQVYRHKKSQQEWRTVHLVNPWFRTLDISHLANSLLCDECIVALSIIH